VHPAEFCVHLILSFLSSCSLYSCLGEIILHSLHKTGQSMALNLALSFWKMLAFMFTQFAECTWSQIYILSRIPRLCVVVLWLITLRGFGLDTGFIHYGDL
jgi:hypothetical protein